LPHKSTFEPRQGSLAAIHFFAVLVDNQQIDLRPEYIIILREAAKVFLPLCVDAAVRVGEARNVWLSERNARKMQLLRPT